MATPASRFQFLKLTRNATSNPHVAVLSLSRPSQLNALTPPMLSELKAAMASLDEDPHVRVIVLNGSGKHFCSGIDISSLAQIAAPPVPTNAGSVNSCTDCTGKCTNHCTGGGCENGSRDGCTDSCTDCGAHNRSDVCEGRLREKLRRDILGFQECISAVENCRKPVIAAVHGVCIGAGIDLVAACDFRYCETNAKFSVKEVDMALAADFGTLQRLPKIVGDGNARELALTGREFGGEEALRLGFVQKIYGGVDDLKEGVMEVAKAIALKSPLAIAGTKSILLHARDHSVRDGLDYVATWNSAMLISSDMREVMAARKEKRFPRFSKL